LHKFFENYSALTHASNGDISYFHFQHFNKNDGTPVMIIGHHILNGKIVTMDSPFLVMRKKSGANLVSSILQ
jgi:hypothetical protein